MQTMEKKANPFHNKLYLFLKKCGVKDGVYTHTSMGQPYGAYNIPENKLSEFINIYNEVVFKDGTSIHLTEAPPMISPIKSDLDFKYKSINLERRYDIEMIKKVCQLYITEIEKWTNDLEPLERMCFIYEKSTPTYSNDNTDIEGNRDVKDGLHIMFPYIIAHIALQHKIREYVFKNLGPIMDDMNLTNSYSDVVDIAVIDRNNWMMYGSSKPNSEPYKITHIFKVFTDHIEDIDTQQYTNEALVDILSIRNKTKITPIRKERLEELKVANNKISIFARKRQLSKQKKKLCKTRWLNKKEVGIIENIVDILSVKRASNRKDWIELGWALHNIHNKDERLLLKWIEFSKRDKRYANEAEDACRDQWYIMTEDTLGQGSLRMWAKHDNLEAYNNIRSNEIQDLLLSSIKSNKSSDDFKSIENWLKQDCELPSPYWELYKIEFEQKNIKYLEQIIKCPDDIFYSIVNNTKEHYQIVITERSKLQNNQEENNDELKQSALPWDIANVVHGMYKDEFICVSFGNKMWYQYNQQYHRWIQLDREIVPLRERLSKEVYQEYIKYLSTWTSHALANTSDKNTEKKQEDARKGTQKILKTIRQLKNTTFKANIMTECSEIFWDQGNKGNKFCDKLDESPHLIGFLNGVYDLNKMEFRNGRPEDYISMTTGINYIEYDPNDIDIISIYEFLEKVLPNHNVREYVLTLLSSFLNGSTKNEQFHIWTGSGGNGKSKLIELFELAFGEYCCKLPITLLTKSRKGSGEASPEVARTKGKRFASLQEPDENTRINVGLMKELTGGDTITARSLYKEPIEFKPQFKMILTCNDKPKLPPHDQGTWRRVRLVEFGSRFVKNPDPEKENEFEMDINLAENFIQWREPFMSLLIHYYSKYLKDGLKEPKEVIEYTKEYQKENDQFLEFINDHIVRDELEVEPLEISDLYQAYKSWFSNNFGKDKPKGRKDLRTYMENKFGPYLQPGRVNKDGKICIKGWLGIKIIYQDEDVGEQDELDM